MMARGITADVHVDRLTSASDLVEFAHYEHQLSGAHSYVRTLRIDASCAPLDLLPASATVERCVTTDATVTVLASVAGASIYIQAFARATNVRVAAATDEHAHELAEELQARAPIGLADSIKVRIWHHRCDGQPPAFSDREIDAPRWDDIASNYMPDARSALASLVSIDRPTSAGRLLLWHGPPGTGKTTALRALMRAWQPWCQAQYISDPERFFAEPSYMAHVLTTAPVASVGPRLDRAADPEAVWRLVIAEDSDEYLRASARRDAGAALGRLLNLCDGILGQGMNVLVLLTTNEETARLHPAIVRPGRCLASVEFSAFSQAEASRWLSVPAAGPATLAELLEQRGAFGRVGASHKAPTPTGLYL